MKEILPQHIYQISCFSLFMSEEMYFIKEFRELLVCQRATNLLPSHSALPHFKRSAEEFKGVKIKITSLHSGHNFLVGLKN